MRVDPGIFFWCWWVVEELTIQIWSQVAWPILRILFFVSVGLVVASLIESMKWTDRLAVLARPLIRLGHLSAITGASFSMAFVSGVSANTMLAEALDKGQLTKKEMVLANLFNSLPRFFLHLPTVFFLTLPFIGGAALYYVGITLTAAVLQTTLVVLVGRCFLPSPQVMNEPAQLNHQSPQKKRLSLKEALAKSIKRLKKRMKRIVIFLIPVYILFFILNSYGVFQWLEEVFASAWFLSWLHPQSLSIVLMHVTVEFSAGLAAASVLLAENSLGQHEIVLALIAGNILAAPVRAVRHQLPYYMGIFPSKMALELVAVSQVVRAVCVAVVGYCYYLFGT